MTLYHDTLKLIEAHIVRVQTLSIPQQLEDIRCIRTLYLVHLGARSYRTYDLLLDLLQLFLVQLGFIQVLLYLLFIVLRSTQLRGGRDLQEYHGL